jgi:hypothetical protein
MVRRVDNSRNSLARRVELTQALQKAVTMMLDWNQYREQLLKAIGDLGRLSPQTVRGIGS